MHPNDTLLNDYVDGTLGPAERRDVEEHLAGCAECRALVDDLREIRALAASLEPRDPPARAWPRLERAIRFEQEAHGARTRSAGADEAVGGARLTPSSDGDAGGRLKSSRYLYGSLAAAAAILIAVFVGLKYRPAPSTPVATNASSAASTADASAQSVEAELRAAEAHYENAIRGLEQVTNAEKGALDTQTAATLQKNLAVIDQAISESRAAVRAQPASEPAQESLIESFKAKLSLLQDTVALINEMRKGNEAGAARIGSGLTKKG